MKGTFPDGLDRLTIEPDPIRPATRFVFESDEGDGYREVLGVAYSLATLQQIHEFIGQIIEKQEAGR